MNTTAAEDVLILAIESSCDETAASVVKNGRTVLSNVISSQIATHTVYGGVVPEIASREHIKAINYVIERALSEANVTLEDITAIGVTYGPGLVGALLVGVAEAKAIAYAAHKPLIGVHHIEGHVSANFINHAKMTGEEIYVPDLVASFQNAVVDVLVSRAITAAKEYGYKKLAIAGGVASNSALRAAMKEACDKNGITFYHPSPIFCTDNAAMIGVAAYYEYIKGNRSGWDLNAVPNLKLGER